MSDYEYLLVEKKGPVLEVWLNRPDARNALSTALEDEWDDVLTFAAGDDDIHVVTLQGKGPVFSAGADMKEFARTYVERPDGATDVTEEEAPVESRRPVAPNRQGAEKRLWPPPAIEQPSLPLSWHFRKTLIAGVHGYVGPVAQRLLAPFDIVIAAEGTRFSWEHTRMGSQNKTLGILAFQLPMRVINQLLLLGGWFDAEKAHELHLVARVVPLEDLPPTVEQFAASAAGLPIGTIAAYKEGIHRMYEIAGLLGMVGIGNNLNPHTGASRGEEFHGTLLEKGLDAALDLRRQDVDPEITRI